MQHSVELRRDLVLVGGGHSHALALRMLAMRPINGLRITLISPSSHSPYSGMLPGLVAGHYCFEQAHIDLARLCQWAGARFICAAVTGLAPDARSLSLAGRPSIEYDILSLDIGSQPELDSVPGARDYATPVKPVAGLWQRWQNLLTRISAVSSSDAARIAVVGGGAGSVELVLAMSQCLPSASARFDLWCAAPDILQGYNARARASVSNALKQRGISVHLNARVAEVGDHYLLTTDGLRANFDEVFWCTGAAAAPWIGASGLTTDDHGFLAVRDTLQSVDDDRIFGAGDIAVQLNHPRPKAGVYAVRQAPVLAHNLRAALLQSPLREHHPQRRFLSLISLGDKLATADKALFSASGRWVWRWKDHIDRKFMARFEKLPMPMPHRVQDSLPEVRQTAAQGVCGGCGAKVGADALDAVLQQLGRDYPQHCIGAGDDAAAIPTSPGAAIFQSVDVVRELVSDLWQMGRIAALHALSDLYACGVRPTSAMAIVTLPYAGSALLERELYQLLAGALHEFAAADCQLIGGHSMQGSELAIGFVVNGVPMSRDGKLLPKVGVKTGDQLLLTKALGTGTLFAAHMQLAADGRDISAAIASMLYSNGRAAELAMAHGSHACTDITGFGLLGHLLEMLAGKHGARISLTQLPLLPGALELSRAGIVSTMHAANVRSAGHYAQHPAAADDDLRTPMLFDPQTSGGLLIAVPAARAQALSDALLEHGYPEARVIGEVIERGTANIAPVQFN
jgi:selenide,water dikinase